MKNINNLTFILGLVLLIGLPIYLVTGEASEHIPKGFINLMPQWIGNVLPSDQINVLPVLPRTLMIVGSEKLTGIKKYSFFNH